MKAIIAIGVKRNEGYVVLAEENGIITELTLATLSKTLINEYFERICNKFRNKYWKIRFFHDQGNILSKQCVVESVCKEFEKIYVSIKA